VDLSKFAIPGESGPLMCRYATWSVATGDVVNASDIVDGAVTVSVAVAGGVTV
jgi:hypothetical protein